MAISLVEKSSYYKGLLVVMGKDRMVHPRERELVLQFGRVLDFEKRFCEAAINDLLENAHLTDEPVIFSSHTLAKCFLRDAIGIALADEAVHPQELAFLKAVARANGLTDEWLDTAVQSIQEQRGSCEGFADLEIQQYL